MSEKAMTRKAAEKLGWIFGTTTGPRTDRAAGGYAITPALARAEKRYAGTRIPIVAAGESVKAAEKRLLVLIEAQERAWASTGQKEAAPPTIKTGVRSTHERVRRA